MRKLGKITLTIVLLIGGAVLWYNLAYPTYTYRYRLSIAVDVGGEIKTASSVIEVILATRPLPEIFSSVERFVYGDAVFLDMGSKGNVVVLLACGPDGTEGCVAELVPRTFGVSGGLENLPKLQTLHGSRELTGKFMPTLITFGNLTDPKSARVVVPDQFEQVFGPGVHLKRVWIEMTDDPVTRGIERDLPWWNLPGRPALEAYRAWLKGKTEGPSIGPESLFKRG
jgi:hypothetical protein